MRPTTLPEPWRSLAAKLGGVQALAEALGTSRRTLDHWARGDRTPGGTAQVAISALFRAHHLEPPCWP
jgi:transcriptional regulator with XRE-family HTH domain